MGIPSSLGTCQEVCSLPCDDSFFAAIVNTGENYKNYICKKCETLLQSATVPHVSNCPSGGNHQ